MKPLLIVNPASGGGRVEKDFHRIERETMRSLGPCDIAWTDRKGHAIQIARDAALSQREIVIAVGGDGLLHEVVNGLMLARERQGLNTRLGVIAQGTGGDFRKSLGIDHRLTSYCEAIAKGRTRHVDVGRMRYINHKLENAEAFFVNILSVGMGGLVDQYVAESSRQFGGTLAYLAASSRALRDSAVGVLRCEMRVDGRVQEHVIRTRSLAICNGQYFGSGMRVAPMAHLDDGVFEIIDLGNAPRLAFMLSNLRIYNGTHLKSSSVNHYRCDQIDLDLVNASVADQFILDVDGEPLGRLPLRVELVPRALEVFGPT